METELLGAAGQLGAAGLIGWMWLSERRAASKRERQLTEAHERLERERVGLASLVTVVRRNTRALGRLEAQQRSLGRLLERALDRRGGDG
ncbi:MAG: hypothetical protein AAGG07_08745 [Planctomycetota bacterium]